MPAAKNKQLTAWDRQIDLGESPAAFQLFWVFLELDKRSLQGVVEESGRSLGLISKLSSKFKWAPRARAFDKHLINMQLKVIESTTKSEAILWAKREYEYRNEAFENAEKLNTKANEMLEAPLYETVIDTVTDIIGEGGQIIHVPTKVIKRPVRWNYKDALAMQELSDKLKRQSLGMPTARIAVDTNWVSDPAQRLAQAKTMMLNWVKTKLDSAVERVCKDKPDANPYDVRTKLLAEVPIWFAENYELKDDAAITALIEALPALLPAAQINTALSLDGDEDYEQ